MQDFLPKRIVLNPEEQESNPEERRTSYVYVPPVDDLILSTQEKEALQEYSERINVVRDRVRGVVSGLSTGLYLYGDGGIGKSWTVIDELKKHNRPYYISNSRITPKGLVEILSYRPDHIHVLEDCETVLKNELVSGVLRSALWTATQTRRITWSTAKEHIDISFTGGVIFCQNEPLSKSPTLRAFATRIAVLELSPSELEKSAKMHEIALEGYEAPTGDYLTIKECVAVWRFLVDHSSETSRPLDFRMLINGYHDYIQWNRGEATTHWHDLTISRMSRRVETKSSKAAKREEETLIAQAINEMPVKIEEKLKLWKEKTGKSKDAYYSRLKGQ